MSVYEQIKDDLGYLQLDRAAECFATLAEDARSDDWTHIEFLGRLVAEQADATRNRRLAPGCATPVPVPQDHHRVRLRVPAHRRPRLIDDLATLRFMDTGRPILFLGQPGCGKTHLAVAVATLAVEAGFRGYFTNAEEMVANIAQATREGNLASKLKTYTAPSVLVIDDVGLLPWTRCRLGVLPSGQPALRETALHHRHHQPRLPDWGEIFGDTVVAAAILDRLMHDAVVFNIKGRPGGASPAPPHHRPRPEAR